ncbi:hypothetical protein F4861DRAFT_541892 [Xylaria intraflava]|nr:hypothetical protein F4861DRAFT_541892 [Xylaria intraflava]
MTQQQLPQRYPAGRRIANPRSRLSPPTSARFAGESANHVSPDTVLPSIERTTDAEGAVNNSTPPGSSAGVSLSLSFSFSDSSPHQGSSARVPSISFSSSASPSPSRPQTRDGRSSSREREPLPDSLDAQLEALRLSSRPTSSMNLRRMADALRSLSAENDTRASPLLDTATPASVSPSPEPREHRRRSGSRVDMVIHRVEDEEPPSDRFNNPSFQSAFRDAKQSMHQLADVLSNGSVPQDPDSVMQRLKDQAVALAEFQCPSKRTVGFVGGTGVGKSSLLNSLLDCRGLARSDNSGRACTCVVTEYHFHDGTGPTSFALEVDCFSTDEIEAQLRDLLQEYRHFHLDRDSLEPTEIEDLKKRAEIALHTFQAIFRGLLVDDSMLTRDTESNVLDTFHDWLQDAQPFIPLDRQYTSTLEDCSSRLLPLSSETTSDESIAVWPWIKKIKVYVNAHILRKGLILVDLPGLLDANSARRHITERYLLECDEIFVVCNEGRATDDLGVQTVIELARQAKLSNLVKAHEAMKGFKREKAAKLQNILTALEQAESKISQHEKDIEDLDDIEELKYLRKELRTAREMKGRLYFEKKRFVITDRNASVESKLHQKYGDKSPSFNALKVFCVSNELYNKHRKKPRDEAMRWLDLSGILAVRKHCCMMVSESQYRAATHYMENDIEVLIGELKLWVRSGEGSLSAERKAVIRDALDTVEQSLYTELCEMAAKIDKILGADFRAKMPLPRSDEVNSWGMAAGRASENWARWHHATYHAFCGNYGTHSTAAVGYHNWNEELIEGMARDLGPVWEDLSSSIHTKGEDTLDIVDDLFERAIRHLVEELTDTDLIRTLNSTLMSHKRTLKVDMATNLTAFDGKLRTLRTDALSGLRSSFIGKAMEDAYRSAGFESGKSPPSSVLDPVGRHGLFADLLKSLKTEFKGHVDETQENMEKTVHSHLDGIGDMFDIIRSENAALESEGDPEFRNRVEETVRMTVVEMDRVRASIRHTSDEVDSDDD